MVSCAPVYAEEPAVETYEPISETANYSAPVASVDESAEPASAMSSSSSAATSGVCGDNLTWEFDEATGTLTISGTGDTIWDYDPSWADDARLPPWYVVREKIKTLVFPCQISRIGNYSFADCVNLIDVKLPDSLQALGMSAFSGCSSLSAISLPEGVTLIQGGAFENCNSLAEAKLPDSVNILGDSVFFGCSSLTKASLPNEISELPINTFGKCEKLTVVTLPNSITRIGSYAFGECTNLQTIIIPNSVTSIEDSAFYGCIRISKIELPTELKTIGYSAFENCASLVEVSIPDGVSNLGAAAFRGCTGLRTAYIPDSVRNIEHSLFRGCSSLANLELPNVVASIGDTAFDGCSSITEFTVPFGTESIGSGAFSGCSSLSSITIPGSISRIEDFAFDGCENLKAVHLYDIAGWCNVELGQFGASPFLYGASLYDLDSLVNNLTIPDTVSAINDRVFQGCGSISSLTISSNVSSIGQYAFSYCNNLIAVEIHDGVDIVDEYAFSNCSNLRTIMISGNNITLETGAFMDCTSLRNVTLPKDLFKISNHLFSGCSALQSITLPNSISTIGEDAFYGCSNLSSVNFPHGLSSIGEEAFRGCSLARISIPASIKTISDYVFAGNDITSVVIPSGITSIGLGAFNDCFYMASITIPTSVTIIEDAFLNCQALDDVYYLGSREMWSSISISPNNDRLLDANIHFAIETVDDDDSGLGNGTSADISKVYITSKTPSMVCLPALGVFSATFNTEIRRPNENEKDAFIHVVMYGDDEPVYSINTKTQEVSIEGNEISFSLSGLNLERGEAYYIKIDSGAFYSLNGGVSYKGNSKPTNVSSDDWVFDYPTVSSSDVNMKYSKKFLWLFVDDTSKPPYPDGTDSEYAQEIMKWATMAGITNLHYETVIRMLDDPAYLPATDDNNSTYLINDGNTTLKQVVEDIIFIENLQPYIEKLDASLDDSEEAYKMVMDWYEQIDAYMDKRSGKSNLFYSAAMPLAYRTLTKLLSTAGGSVYAFTSPMLTANLTEAQINNSLASLEGYADYQDYQQTMSSLSTVKNIYKATVGSTSDKISFTIDFLAKNYSGAGSEILKEITDTSSQLKSIKNAIMASMYMGSSIGLFPLVVDFYNSSMKNITDTVGSLYFIYYYYIYDKYPDYFEKIYDDEHDAPSDSLAVIHWKDSQYKNDEILSAWRKYMETYATDNNMQSKCTELRRDLSNYCLLLLYAKYFDVDSAKISLAQYLSAVVKDKQTPKQQLKVSCPVIVNVYEKSTNSLIASLSSEDDSIGNCEYGSLYLMGESNETKCFLLYSGDYYAEIIPYDDGEMEILVTDIDETGSSESVFYKSVTLSDGTPLNLSSLSIDASLTNGVETMSPTEIIPVSEISIGGNTEIAVGDSADLTALVAPETATDKSLTWSSSNPGVIEVSNDGVITAKSAGEATITATAANGVSSSVEVSAYTPAQNVSLDVSSLKMCVGEEYKLAANINPSNATHPIKWYSSAGSVAFVDENGSVYAQSEGIAVITADIDGVSASVTVTVSEEPISIILYQSDTNGDRIKVDMLNNSLYSGYTGSVFVSIYDADGRMLATSELPLALGAGTHTTGYIPITNWDGHSELTAKAFTIDGQMLPVSSSTEINVIG